jgi:hypothetical protein
MASRPVKKKRRTTTTTNGTTHGTEQSGSDDRGGQITRTLRILEMLAHGPQTTHEIARAEKISMRTTMRFMKILAAHTPIYLRKKPGDSSSSWTLDVEEYVARFKA